MDCILFLHVNWKKSEQGSILRLTFANRVLLKARQAGVLHTPPEPCCAIADKVVGAIYNITVIILLLFLFYSVTS